jgi:hypothetical protein
MMLCECGVVESARLDTVLPPICWANSVDAESDGRWKCVLFAAWCGMLVPALDDIWDVGDAAK